MAGILPYIQVGLSILLGAAILLQRSDASLSEAFGGSGGGVGHHTRRGLERVLFRVTVLLSILFVATAIIAIMI